MPDGLMRMSTSFKATLIPCQRGDGTWYVEVIRPRIVREHLGAFPSKGAARRWIRDNEALYLESERTLVPTMIPQRTPGSGSGQPRQLRRS